MRLTILRYDSLPSTNTEAATQARSGAPEGLCIVAREQTEGRGRHRRQWVSPLDAGLYFSIILRPRVAVSEWTLATLMTAVAVSDALREAYLIETDIKWPNDVLASGRKLCGILAETISSELNQALVLGIGINLKQSGLPPDLREAVSVEELIGREPEPEHVLKQLTAAIDSQYTTFQSHGGAARIVAAWKARSSYAEGMHVRVSFADDLIEGVTRGLEPDGALRVETTSGTIRVIRAGDVSALRKR